MNNLSVSKFDPTIIPSQIQVLKDVRKNHDYSTGPLEILLSGSVGSSKSVLMAHLGVTHCLFNPMAKVLLARRALADLRDTLFTKIIEQLDDENLVEGRDYWYYENICKVVYKNGAQMIAKTWADNKPKKMRSLDLSMALIEEGSENADMDYYKEIKLRIGRISTVKENVIIMATNPDSPAHPIYKYFIESDNPRIKTYYSLTEDNPFLDKSYINSLKETMSPKEADRMLRGRWIELNTEVIYHNYDAARNFINQSFIYQPNYPLDLMFDFNIGFQKPMSSAVGQVIGGTFHISKSFLIEGARTGQMMEEIIDSGILDMGFTKVRVFGDASGTHKDTRNVKSDYDIIVKALQNYRTKKGGALIVEYKVPLANPAIRDRENLVNGLFLNELGQTRMYIYKDAKDVDNGFRLAKYKKGAQLIEDDSLKEQHVTTAVGYYAHYEIKKNKPLRPVEIS